MLKAGFHIIQIGTDCPELDERYINEAKEKLKKYDIVIGPASDGGYTLLAQKKYHGELYTSIQWGTSSVLTQLVSNIDKTGLDYYLLKTLSDIDTNDDLDNYKLSVV